MLLLIDGYNLLHQSDLLGRGRGEDWLRRARNRLLRQLAKHLDDSLRPQTCIVFDAEDPPPGRPSQIFYHEIDVRFAVNHPEADDLLEEIIAHHPAPNRLTVVSSDHRVQRAAQRRRGHFFDSDSWYVALIDAEHVLGIRNPKQANSKSTAKSKESLIADLAAQSTEEWLREFGLDVPSAPTPSPASPPKETPAQKSPPSPDALDSKPKVVDDPPSSNILGDSPGANILGVSPRPAKKLKKPSRPPKAKRASTTKPSAKPAGKRPSKKQLPLPKTNKLPKPESKQSDETERERARRQLKGDADQIFPEGYGEDLL
ncbi:YacP-like NYN domain protein [Roseimaritima multifibrata]|uniref:YacP-like NYN domain protein n=1 Tax=Roseimaritima multifibrata TaxID=1930274 RepID=A0A517MM10_9BACT|nr:NYN domain-containing protein [Roseimaritima multifibrata]QDS95797.1 YacP-like NYN domain protein [Roseimaritima multifibrata]